MLGFFCACIMANQIDCTKSGFRLMVSYKLIITLLTIALSFVWVFYLSFSVISKHYSILSMQQF